MNQSKKSMLETNRTTLRCFDEHDLESLHSLHTDPSVMEYLVGKVRQTKEETATDLKKYIDHQQQFGFGKWAVIHKETGEFMGRAGLVKVPNRDEIDLGYALHQKFWGKGYATEIAKALHEYAVKTLKTYNIVGLVKKGNDGSIRILEKINYAWTGQGDYFGESFEVYRPKEVFKISTDFFSKQAK